MHNAHPSDLEKLVPAGIKVTVGKDTLTLLPLKVGQLPAMLRAIGPLAGSLNQESIDWFGLLALNSDALLDAIAIGCNKPRVWIDALDADDALVLAAKVVEVNADFFALRVMPKFEVLFQTAQNKSEALTSAPNVRVSSTLSSD